MTCSTSHSWLTGSGSGPRNFSINSPSRSLIANLFHLGKLQLNKYHHPSGLRLLLTRAGFSAGLQTKVQAISADILQPAARGRYKPDLCWKLGLAAAIRRSHQK